MLFDLVSYKKSLKEIQNFYIVRVHVLYNINAMTISEENEVIEDNTKAKHDDFISTTIWEGKRVMTIYPIYIT